MTPLGPDAVLAYVETATGAPLDADEAAWLASRLHYCYVAVGQPVVQEGDRCRSVAFVATGLVRVTGL